MKNLKKTTNFTENKKSFVSIQPTETSQYVVPLPSSIISMQSFFFAFFIWSSYYPKIMYLVFSFNIIFLAFACYYKLCLTLHLKLVNNPWSRHT